MNPDPDEHAHPGQEDLRWGDGTDDKLRKKGSAPTAKYNKLSEQARRLIAGESQCAMFCGGKKCKYCTADNWKPEQMVVKGLYSEWVTDNILAMARPSNYGFDNFRILQQFEENNIKAVINLQQPGEHASCGDGNDSSGFSYNPQRLMDKEIFFYNFAWQDYGIAPMSTLLDIVKVMQFSVSMGKVAVHCHAGLGRTGLLIACYLVYNNRVPAGEAVHYVRSRRPGAIQTRQQVQTVYDFETHLKPFRTIFPSKVSEASEVSFKHFLNRQSHMIHGYEARKLKHIPKVMYVCCERLLELAGRGQSLSKVRNHSSLSTVGMPTSAKTSSESLQLPGLSQLSVRSENNMSEVSVTRKFLSSVSFEDLTNTKFKEVLTEDKGGTEEDSNTSLDLGAAEGVFCDGADHKDRETVEEDDDDDCIVFGKQDIARTDVENPVANQPLVKAKVEQSCDGATPDSSLNHFKSDQPTDCVKPGHSVKETDSDVDGNKVSSGPSSSVDLKSENSGATSDADSKGKRKVKKKGLKDRLKARAGKKEDVVSVTTSRENVSEEGEKNGGRSEDQKSVGSGPESDLGSKSDTSSDRLTVSSRAAVQGDADEMSLRICNVMAATDYSADVRQKADHIEMQLNETDAAWSLLANEEDPCVLSAVLWDWLDQLKEPVLRRQDLTLLLEWSGGPKECLRHFEKYVKDFIEYQALVLSKLFPQSEDVETRLAERLLSHLTHHAVTLNLTTFTSQPNQPSHWGEMRSSESSRLIEFFFQLIGEVASQEKPR